MSSRNCFTKGDKFLIRESALSGVTSIATGNNVAWHISFGIIESVNTVVSKLAKGFVSAFCGWIASAIKARLFYYFSEFFFGNRKLLMPSGGICFVTTKKLIERRLAIRESLYGGWYAATTTGVPGCEVCAIYDHPVAASALAQPGNAPASIGFSGQNGKPTILFTNSVNKARVPLAPTDTSATGSISRCKVLGFDNLLYSAVAFANPRCPSANVRGLANYR